MSNGRVVFTTKGDNRVWAFDPVAMTLTIIYDDDVQVNGVLSGVDNVGTTHAGVVYVAEDGGDMQFVLVRDNGATYPVVELPDVSRVPRSQDPRSIHRARVCTSVRNATLVAPTRSPGRGTCSRSPASELPACRAVHPNTPGTKCRTCSEVRPG